MPRSHEAGTYMVRQGPELRLPVSITRALHACDHCLLILVPGGLVWGEFGFFWKKFSYLLLEGDRFLVWEQRASGFLLLNVQTFPFFPLVFSTMPHPGSCCIFVSKFYHCVLTTSLPDVGEGAGGHLFRWGEQLAVEAGAATPHVCFPALVFSLLCFTLAFCGGWYLESYASYYPASFQLSQTSSELPLASFQNLLKSQTQDFSSIYFAFLSLYLLKSLCCQLSGLLWKGA